MLEKVGNLNPVIFVANRNVSVATLSESPKQGDSFCQTSPLVNIVSGGKKEASGIVLDLLSKED